MVMDDGDGDALCRLPCLVWSGLFRSGQAGKPALLRRLGGSYLGSRGRYAFEGKSVVGFYFELKA